MRLPTNFSDSTPARVSTRSSKTLTLLLAVVSLLAGVTGTAHPAAEVSRDDAVQIVTDTLLGGSLADVRLFIYTRPIESGTVVSSWKDSVFTASADGWFIFIDLMPGANWEHPCRYVFVERESGEVRAYDAQVPPRLQSSLVEITHGRDNPPPGMSEQALALFNTRLKELPKPPLPDRGRPFAFIISGGASAEFNHVRYWNDCAFIYSTLVNYYSYPEENIYVCISDGLDPAPDRSDGTNSPADLDGDLDPDIQYPATMQYITQVFEELATILTPGDQLFVFTTDHGGQESGWDCYLNLWNWEEMRDDQLAAFVNALPCQTVVAAFQQCFSGGMIDDLAATGRVISTASRWDEVSYGMPPDYVYDTFDYYWISAVAWQDPYGNPVNADTDGDGYVSMREAFVYVEAHDQQNETPQYSSTPGDLGNWLNLSGAVNGVWLWARSVLFDDDDIGASHGDGDGTIEFNETIEATIELYNLGDEDAFGVEGTLSSSSPFVAFAEDRATFGDIPSDATAPNATPFVFHVAHDVPDGEPLSLILTASEEPVDLAIPASARAPEYAVRITALDDSGGDGDGIADPGETVTLAFYVENSGGCASPELEVVLGSGSDYFIPDQTPRVLRALNVGEGEELAGFAVEISPDCPEIFTHYLRLEMSGPELYEKMVPIIFAVGQVFADNLESGSASWTHYAGGEEWFDQWHLETYRNHTPGGTTSWKCGGAGSATYGNLLYSILETETLDLPPAVRLNFWQWCDAETSTAHPGYAYDGGLLQISTDGGASWNDLTPDGGYPFLIRARTSGRPGPFANETPVWSGRPGWHEVSVDLAGYSGPAKLRWAFGSDCATMQQPEGWYIDDLRISAQPPSAADGEVAQIITPRLLPARPNPVLLNGAAGTLVIQFALPQAVDARVELFDLSGRLVRTLYRGRAIAGLNEAVWDGRDTDGRAAPAGAYYYRLMLGGKQLGGRLALIR